MDLRRVAVHRAGEPVPLEPKAFDVLRHLLENRDRLVTKDELLDAVWKDTFVTPNVLTRVVAQLRKGLGDDAHEARYIETVAKRGYRFIAPVAVDGDGRSDARTVEYRRASADGAPPAGPRRKWLLMGTAAVLATLVVWGVALRRPLARPPAPSTAADAPTPRRLTVEADAYGRPAVSLDGTAVAYVSERTGSAEVVVLGLAPGSRPLAITSDGGRNVEPAFSPDGQWIAYQSLAGKGIWVIPARGGVPRQVAPFGAQPSWSADSETLVFTSFAGGLTSQAVLWTVRRDGSAPVPLTTQGNPPGGHLSPAWSHDGRFIAFRVGRHEANELWIVRSPGGAPWRVLARSVYLEPAFAPDDRALLWFARDAERNTALFRLRLEAGGTAAGKPEVILRLPGFAADRLSIARDGTAVFAASRLSVNLFGMPVGADGAAGAPVQLTDDEDAVNSYPAYGPGGRIAFEQTAAGRPTMAWVMDADGRNREPLSAGVPASVRVPQWDADGRRVFVVVQPRGAESPYYAWIDVGTRRLTRIPLTAVGPPETLPALSPDGQRLAYHLVAADGSLNVWIQRLDDGSRRQVTFDREAMSYPRWSPDGRWLAVQVKRGPETHVGVVAAEGGPVELLTSGPGSRSRYSFAPDGDRIAFVASGVPGSGEEGKDNIFLVSRGTRDVRQLTRMGARFPVWSPRGDRIVFASPKHVRSLWTVKLPD
ncbi:MAG TPA: winged helix-turn-helix domain-containing protein [Vicinamibacteria bacterium]|nr:winged helix-turn-helix domain-containing protein [Vicinamibacteria bacterium]